MSEAAKPKPETNPESPAAPNGGNQAFAAKMQDSKILKGMIDAISAIIDETYFVADANGLSLGAMDESHICMMSATLPAALFDEYTCAYLAKLGINLEDLTKIMKRAGGADAVEFKHAQESEKFQVTRDSRCGVLSSRNRWTRASAGRGEGRSCLRSRRIAQNEMA